MAEKTASVHVSRILAKLDVRSRTEAAAVAVRQGLVTSRLMRALVTGATGFVGGRLAARSPSAARTCAAWCGIASAPRTSSDAGLELHEGDVLDAETPARAPGEGVDVAYYLVHSMGRGGERDGLRASASARRPRTSRAMAREEGVERVVYLGGLGDEPRSEHLRSRARDGARCSPQEGPPLTYFRAAMVVGAGSESYRTLRYLVERLPAMIAPAWLRNRTQPIAIDDVLEYLAQAAERPERGRARGPDRRRRTCSPTPRCSTLMADVLGKRRRPQTARCRCSPRGSPRSGSASSRRWTPASRGR